MNATIHKTLIERAAERPELQYHLELGQKRARLMVRVNALHARRLLPCIQHSRVDLDRILNTLNTMNLNEIEDTLARLTPLYNQAMREPHPLNPADTARWR